MVEVGRVERVGIAPDGKRINFTIFIKEKYVPFINTESKFYTRSTFNIDFSNANLDMNIAPISQLLHGGISIYTPINSLDTNNTLKGNEVFRLYKNLAQMKTKELGTNGDYITYKFKFKEPITNLKIGSPIKFKDFQVGYITNIKNSYSNKNINSTIYGIIEADAFRENNSSMTKKDIISDLIKHGLRARLSSPIPIVGSQYIELLFNKHHKINIVKIKKYNTFPTIKKIKSQKNNIMNNINDVLVKLKNLPLENLLNSYTNLAKDNRKSIHSLVKNLNKTINGLNHIVKNLNNFTSQQEFTQLPENINNLLQEIEITLIDLQQLTKDYDSNSQFADQLSATLKATVDALKSFNKTNQVLSRKANSLIVGDE